MKFLRSIPTAFMIILLVVLSVFSVTLTGCSSAEADTESTSSVRDIDAYINAMGGDKKTESKEESKPESNKDDEETVESLISDDIRSYEILINGELFKFPMTHEELAKTSWTYCGETPLNEAVAEPGIKYEAVYTNGKAKMIFNLINMGEEDTTADNTIVAGLFIQFANEDALTREEVTLPSNVSPTYCDLNSLKSIYGEPSEVFHDNQGTPKASKLIYRKSSGLHSYTIFVDNVERHVREIVIFSDGQ